MTKISKKDQVSILRFYGPLRSLTGIIILILSILFSWKYLSSESEVLRLDPLNLPLFIVLLVAVPLIDIFLSGSRIFTLLCFFSRQEKKVKPTKYKLKDIFFISFFGAATNAFFGQILPSGSGGGAVQMGYLILRGISLKNSFQISVMTFVGTALFLIIGGAWILLFLDDSFFAENKLLISIFYLGLGLLFTFLISGFLGKSGFIESLYKKSSGKSKTILHNILELFNGLRELTLLLKNKAFMIVFLWVLFASSLIYVNKILAGFFLLSLLGENVSFGLFFTRGMEVTVGSYFFPTPGGSGFAEILSVKVFDQYMNEPLLFAYLWRGLTTYIAIPLWGLTLFFHFLFRRHFIDTPTN